MWLTWDKQIIPKITLLFGYSVKWETTCTVTVIVSCVYT